MNAIAKSLEFDFKEFTDNEICKHKKIKPFLKWAGGKGQLLSEIESFYPFFNKSITKYAEPFVGGGAVLFDILSKFDLEGVYISDINEELINTYRVIQSHADELIEMLYKFQSSFLPLNNDMRKELYLFRRRRFNELKVNKEIKDNIEKAALMIFLNKTCFNGLYRVNKKGLFNVPMGAYKNPLICDEENIQVVSDALKNVTIVCNDYEKAAGFIDEKTFVYFDPPYRPLSKTANFISYSENPFNDNEQVRLRNFVDKMNKRGARVLVSNSDPKNADSEDNFFDNIYSRYSIKRVNAARMINSNSSKRGKITELIISNNKESI